MPNAGHLIWRRKQARSAKNRRRRRDAKTFFESEKNAELSTQSSSDLNSGLIVFSLNGTVDIQKFLLVYKKEALTIENGNLMKSTNLRILHMLVVLRHKRCWWSFAADICNSRLIHCGLCSPHLLFHNRTQIIRWTSGGPQQHSQCCVGNRVCVWE